MTKKGVGMVTWGMCVPISVPSLNIMQLFYPPFFPLWNEAQGTRRWQYLDQDTNFASPFCVLLFVTQLILSGKYSNHICLTLLPVSLKYHRWLSQSPVVLLKAIRFTFSLFWLKHILAKQRASHFAFLTPCADCPALVLKTLKGLPKTKFTTVDMPFCTWDFSGIWSLIMNALKAIRS